MTFQCAKYQAFLYCLFQLEATFPKKTLVIELLFIIHFSCRHISREFTETSTLVTGFLQRFFEYFLPHSVPIQRYMDQKSLYF